MRINKDFWNFDNNDQKYIFLILRRDSSMPLHFALDVLRMINIYKNETAQY